MATTLHPLRSCTHYDHHHPRWCLCGLDHSLVCCTKAHQLGFPPSKHGSRVCQHASPVDSTRTEPKQHPSAVFGGAWKHFHKQHTPCIALRKYNYLNAHTYRLHGAMKPTSKLMQCHPLVSHCYLSWRRNHVLTARDNTYGQCNRSHSPREPV